MSDGRQGTRDTRGVRGIRGAISVEDDSPEAIAGAVQELLGSIQAENSLCLEDVAGVFFTATPDLTATFPAAAARAMGWHAVPLLCSVEMDVAGALPRCIRVLVLVNSEMSQHEVRHVYLRTARSLRPDLG